MRISDWSSDVCSSDLRRRLPEPDFPRPHPAGEPWRQQHKRVIGQQFLVILFGCVGKHGRRLYGDAGRREPRPERSEEHTSELQSLMRISYAVFCLKKKKTKRLRIKNTLSHITPKTSY